VSDAANSLDALGVTAVVLTHRRPRLAGDVVRSLLEDEGFPPQRVVVVVNGDGGLDDAALEASVQMVWLEDNFGPAAGFGAGILHAFADPNTRWLDQRIALDDKGFVKTGGDLKFPLQTSSPGVFAIGDVRNGSVKRVAAGVGEGAAVVAQIHAYLASLQA